jgi:hypothetical protein
MTCLRCPRCGLRLQVAADARRRTTAMEKCPYCIGQGRLVPLENFKQPWDGAAGSASLQPELREPHSRSAERAPSGADAQARTGSS